MEVSRTRDGVRYLNEAISYAQAKLGGQRRDISRLDPSDRDLVFGITLVYKDLKHAQPDIDRSNPLIRRNIEQLADIVGIPKQALQVQRVAQRALGKPSKRPAPAHHRTAPLRTTRHTSSRPHPTRRATTSRRPTQARRLTRGRTTPSPSAVPPRLDASDPRRGIFGAQTIIHSGQLGTQNVVEFFYSDQDVRTPRLSPQERAVRARQANSRTYGGKRQADYACFANTSRGRAPLMIDGQKWVSREHYYQAQKFRRGSTTYRMIQQGRGPFRATGRLRQEVAKPKYRRDAFYTSKSAWDAASFGIMHKANLAFFSQDHRARALLLSTGTAPIVERNRKPDRWGITFDGPIHLTGATNQNLQGSVLMSVRDQLRKQSGV